MTDVETILQWWPILSLAAFVLIGCALWHLSRCFVRREEHEAMQAEMKTLQATMDEVCTRVARVDQRLEALPGAGDVNKMLLGLEEVRGNQRELTATINGLTEVLKRIEHPVQLLMSEAIKKGAKHGG